MSVPHFKYPLSMQGTSFTAVEQDTPQEIGDCVSVLLQTPEGTRDALPQYGAPEVLFTTGVVDKDAIIAAIRKWEPRAHGSIVDGSSSQDPTQYTFTVQIGAT